MQIDELIKKRFLELDEQKKRVRFYEDPFGYNRVDASSWHVWATSVMNLLKGAFGEDSVQYRNFNELYNKNRADNFANPAHAGMGVFDAAKADYEGGYTFNLHKALSGELFGDFVVLAKQALQDGYKDVAAVLASAALEDALKKFARDNGLLVDDRVMQEVVSALKSRGLVSGAQKSLLDAMPKIRDYAMHANWEKITAADVGSIIGFVDRFLLDHF